MPYSTMNGHRRSLFLGVSGAANYTKLRALIISAGEGNYRISPIRTPRLIWKAALGDFESESRLFLTDFQEL